MAINYIDLDREFVAWSDADAAIAIEQAIHGIMGSLRWDGAAERVESAHQA